MDAIPTDARRPINPHSPATENEPLAKHRSAAAAVLGAILVVFSLPGLFIGIALTQPPGGFVDFSTAGHVLVAVAILVGATGVWLVASGMATPTGATPAPSPASDVVRSDGSTSLRVGADSNPAAETSASTDGDERARDAAAGTITRGAAAGGGRWVSSAILGLAILIGMIGWHASTTPPSMANRVQSATHARNVSCYLKGEINMGDGVRHPSQFYDCISWPATSTNGPTTVGCYVYYHGRLEDVASRLANDPNSWDTWNLFMAPPNADPQGGNVCGTYTW